MVRAVNLLFHFTQEGKNALKKKALREIDILHDHTAVGFTFCWTQ